MGQNLVSVHMSEAEWTEVDALLDALERAFAPQLVSLSSLERRRLVKMGDNSEAFCRRSYSAMHDGQAQLPRSIDLDEMARDLATHDALAKRHARMSRLMERVVDTDIAVGSDIMRAALEGYAALKRAGGGDGMHGLQRELGKRFEGQGVRKPEAAEPA